MSFSLDTDSFLAFRRAFGFMLYFICASLSYILVFDRGLQEHPRFQKGQIKMEIRQASSAMPVMALLTAPFFLAEVSGHSKLYHALSDAPFTGYTLLSVPLFILFTDFFIYLIHRSLHHPLLYKRLHKPHHKWVVPTPFASHAFHPLDGWSQSLLYHIFPLLFPLHKFIYLGLFGFVNFWTVGIHDGYFLSHDPVINGSACHTMHHLYFNYNYGQFTTIWGRIGGSYRKPNIELGSKETDIRQKEWVHQSTEIRNIEKKLAWCQ